MRWPVTDSGNAFKSASPMLNEPAVGESNRANSCVNSSPALPSRLNITV